MTHEWKIGDWCEYAGTRALVIDVTLNRVHVARRDGEAWKDLVYGLSDQVRTPWKDHLKLKHLPDCTGWDWQPPKPIEPPEGYRLLDEGETINECDLSFANKQWMPVHISSIGKKYKQDLFFEMCRKIESKYRPFKNAAEFEPHRDRWILTELQNKNGRWRVDHYNDEGSFDAVDEEVVCWKELFDTYKFEDGEPFGVKE